MSEEKFFWKSFVMGISAATFGWTFVLCYISDKRSSDLKQEAVERGYAEWRLTHAHNGTTEFRWLDKPSPPSPDTVLPPQPE